MNLKNAFEYLNFLNRILDSLKTIGIYNKESLIANVKLIHHLPNEEAKEETKESNLNLDVNYETLFKAMKATTDERRRTVKAINLAKAASEYDLDELITYNKDLRDIANNYQDILAHARKLKNTTTTGTTYILNVNNEQVPYRYDIDNIYELKVDINNIKKTLEKSREELKSNSDLIEQIQINTEVVINPLFNVWDSAEDIIAKISAAEE